MEIVLDQTVAHLESLYRYCEYNACLVRNKVEEHDCPWWVAYDCGRTTFTSKLPGIRFSVVVEKHGPTEVRMRWPIDKDEIMKVYKTIPTSLRAEIQKEKQKQLAIT